MLKDMWFAFLDKSGELFAELVVPLVIVIVLFLGGVFAILATVDYLDCRGFGAATGMSTRWEWSCYANVGDKWVPKKYVFGEANEVRVK